jgi:phosphoribosylformylglycinamidine synthase
VIGVSTRVAVVVFPGSNCEHDVAAALAALGAKPSLVWHEDRDLDEADAVVIPGGFAHGDYLRPGAIARFSPVMDAVGEFARSGGPVLGICNGFQVLTEAGLVPGALRPNDGRRFLCKTVTCTVESATSALTNGLTVGQSLRLPINHYEGNYTIAPDDLARVEGNGQVVLRYDENPNGSVGAIAGVSNERGNVVGLMPHPERASDALLGSADGVALLQAFLRSTAG